MMHDCFDALDIDGNGTLSANDIISSEEGKEFLEALRLKHGIRDGDRNLLPFGLFGIRFKFVQESVAISDEEIARLKKKAQQNPRDPKEDDEDAIDKAKNVINGFIPDEIIKKVDELQDDSPSSSPSGKR